MQNILEKDKLLNNNKHPLYVYLIALYFLITPIEFALNSLTGGSSIKYLGAIIIVVIIVHSFAYRKKLIIREYHFFLLIWLLFILASVLWTVSVSVAQAYLTNYINIVIFFTILTIIRYSRVQIELFLKSIYFGSLLVVFITIFFAVPYENSARYVISFFGASHEPNNLAAFIVFSATLSFWYMFKNDFILKKLFYLIMLFVSIIAVFYTGSRGGFVTIVFSLFFVYLGSNVIERNVNIKSKICVSIFLLVIILLSPYILYEFVDSFLIERIFNFSEYEGGSERLILWSYGFDLFLDNPILGYGLGSYLAMTSRVLHNTYFTVIFESGILGSFFFFSFIVSLILRIFKKRRLIVFAILLSGLIPAFFVDAMIKRFFWNAIIIAAIMINYYSDND